MEYWGPNIATGFRLVAVGRCLQKFLNWYLYGLCPLVFGNFFLSSVRSERRRKISFIVIEKCKKG